ncbi:MAG: hypothetical protein NZ891_06850, partial [bacterium]|nr:hypothetical protein [bacterium]MDW8164443.1 hypothetical protein [Candidatus Omnitrophota bacterium]
MKKLFLYPLNFKDKTSFLLSQIEKLNFTPNFVYFTSNFCKIQDFKYHYYEQFKNTILPSTYTLKSFALNILEENSPKKIISDIEKYLLILEIVKKKKKKITYTDEGISKVIHNFFKELKISSLKGEKISIVKKAISDFPWKYEENRKNIEFAVEVFEEYENLLLRKNMIDLEDIYEEGVEYLLNKNLENIIIENIIEIPPYQKEFIKTLINS